MTLEQAQQINGLTQDQKKLLKDIETAARRFQRAPKEFKATNAAELKQELDEVIARKRTKQSKAKEKQDAKKQCIDL